MAADQKITLLIDDTDSREFTVYRCHTQNYELFRRTRDLLNGSISEWNVGYRRLIDVDLKTLDNDKFDLFWLYQFMMSTSRRIAFETEAYDVVPIEDDFSFEFMSDLFFANALTLHFIEPNITTITDTGITRTLIPLYTPLGQGITGAEGQVLSIYANLFDDSSAEFRKHDFRFISSNRTDLTYGYRHRLKLDLGPVVVPEWRQWLLEYCLWGHREIDSTTIDPVNGTTYQVVYDGDKFGWDLFENIRRGLMTHMEFREKNLRTTVEEAHEPPTETPPIYDEVVADEKVIW